MNVNVAIDSKRRQNLLEFLKKELLYIPLTSKSLMEKPPSFPVTKFTLKNFPVTKIKNFPICKYLCDHISHLKKSDIHFLNPYLVLYKK